MARTIKEEEYQARRNEILDFALRLIYTKGYEKMTIQDILNGLQISRGALYHYFNSKKALLEALVDRMGQTAQQSVLPIIQDPDLSALQKFQRYFEISANWKSLQKEFILTLLPMWFSDENAFIRQKMTSETLAHTSPLLEAMIRQGVEEKVFTTRYPQQSAVIIAGIFLTFAEVIVGRLLAPQPDGAGSGDLQNTLNAYSDAIERILGAPAGSLKFFEVADFQGWLVASAPEPGQASGF